MKSESENKQPEMPDWPKEEEKYYLRTFKRVPVTLVEGEGARVWDVDGKEYLDFVGGWAVNSLGHCHPVLVRSIIAQATTLIHTSNQFYTLPQLRLAELLVQNSCLDRVFFCNSGAEANEGAVKLARKYGKVHLDGAFEVITTLESFHGRTLAMVAATGQQKFQQPYVPMPDGFVNVEYDSVEAIEKAITGRTCAVMLEAIQGEAGVNVPHKDYLKNVKTLCDEKGLLFILDEVQTGIGRLGSLFAYQLYDVEPDIMTLAKGLGGGVPIGAIMAKEKASVFEPGEHGATFGGNPLVCTAAFFVMDYIIRNDVCGNARKAGQYFIEKLEELKAKHDSIVAIRGQGLLLALEFGSDIADDVLMSCLEKGLLINKVKPNIIRFMPPLIITEQDVDKATGILDQTLDSLQ